MKNSISRNLSFLFLTGLLLCSGSYLASAQVQDSYFPIGETNTGGEEEKKKETSSEASQQAQTPENKVQPQTPQPPEAKPKPEPEQGVNSFNFIFDMLYNFNFSEASTFPHYSSEVDAQVSLTTPQGSFFRFIEDLITPSSVPRF